MVFNGGPFRRWLGHAGKVLRNGIRAFIKEGPESSLAPSTMGGRSEKSAIYEPEGRSHQTPNLPVPYSQTSQPPELWEVNFHCLLAIQSAVLCYVSPDELKHSPLPPYTCQKSNKVRSLLNTKPFFGFRLSRSRSGSPCYDLQGPICSGQLFSNCTTHYSPHFHSIPDTLLSQGLCIGCSLRPEFSSACYPHDLLFIQKVTFLPVSSSLTTSFHNAKHQPPTHPATMAFPISCLTLMFLLCTYHQLV